MRPGTSSPHGEEATDTGRGRAASPVAVAVADGRLTACARLLIESRNRIKAAVPGSLFGDPALSMVLELYLAGTIGRRVNLTSLTTIARAPQTTAIRYASLLEAEGWLERYPHPHDRRVVLVRLTARALAALRDYLDGLVPLMRAG